MPRHGPGSEGDTMKENGEKLDDEIDDLERYMPRFH